MVTTEVILPELLVAARSMNLDYILYDGMCPWGYFVARALGLPAVTSLALMPPIQPPPGALLNGALLRAIATFLLRDLHKGIEANLRSRRIGKDLGVPPLGPTALLNALGDLVLSYTSATFQPFASTVPKTVRFVGWTPYEPPADASIVVEQERPLVYISLGTVNNNDMSVFRCCIDAFVQSDVSVLISTGNYFSPDAFEPLPDNITVRSWVPQTAVLKQAVLFVTHGGLNSIHDGLYWGVPLLLVPRQEEQMLNALRVVELGAGLMIRKGQVNTESIRTRATQLLAEPRFKMQAAHIGDTFRAAGGARQAANEVEAFLRR
jgi:MGT family glycosyltransferase